MIYGTAVRCHVRPYNENLVVSRQQKNGKKCHCNRGVNVIIHFFMKKGVKDMRKKKRQKKRRKWISDESRFGKIVIMKKS